jgi:hypothetical protein
MYLALLIATLQNFILVKPEAFLSVRIRIFRLTNQILPHKNKGVLLFVGTRGIDAPSKDGA